MHFKEFTTVRYQKILFLSRLRPESIFTQQLLWLLTPMIFPGKVLFPSLSSTSTLKPTLNCKGFFWFVAVLLLAASFLSALHSHSTLSSHITKSMAGLKFCTNKSQTKINCPKTKTLINILQHQFFDAELCFSPRCFITPDIAKVFF